MNDDWLDWGLIVLSAAMWLVIGSAVTAYWMDEVDPFDTYASEYTAGYADGWKHKHDLIHNRELSRCIEKEYDS